MIKREISTYLKSVALKYPIITVTGPRQSGKTTLVMEVFSKKEYVSLEDPDEREQAIEDPRGFLERFPEGAIIDEVQHVPALFSYLQTRVDKSKKLGEFILTGSQNFLLIEKITQSLSGRAAILHLLPFSLQETKSYSNFEDTLPETLFKGFYPRIHEIGIAPTEWYRNYLTTYIERDVRQLKNITDISRFQTFMKLCAGRIGQLLNVSSLATECGVDNGTINSWLSILEASFIAFRLNPHYKNFNKRLVKQKKLYFYDTGLACYLLGLQSAKDIETHYSKGSLFENMIISEIIKKRFNGGKDPNIYFWRDNHGHEMDILLESGPNIVPIEIKMGQTVTKDFFKATTYWKSLSGTEKAYVVYGGTSGQVRSDGTKVISWKSLNNIEEI